jgi:probable rRNA maturation factor
LVRRQRRIRADWSEIEKFLGRIPPPLAPSPYTVCLLSDRSIRSYNRRFRQKDEATDVLSFPMGPADCGEESYLGDILISVQTAQRNAGRFGLRVEEEIQLLILHGLLHLRGYDHEWDDGQMARQERRWARRLGLAQCLLGRSRSGHHRRPPRLRDSGKRSRQERPRRL